VAIQENPLHGLRSLEDSRKTAQYQLTDGQSCFYEIFIGWAMGRFSNKWCLLLTFFGILLLLSKKMLNPEQKKAVETIYGPVLVLAGPGTGKTHLLTDRIIHLAKGDFGCDYENILCLTFTDTGAKEMYAKLSKKIQTDAYRVKISTFHSFAQHIREKYPEEIKTIAEGEILADDLQMALALREAMEKKARHFFHPSKPLQALFEMKRKIQDLKKENYTPESFRAILPKEEQTFEQDKKNYYLRDGKWGKKGEMKQKEKREFKKRMAKWKELVDIWEEYEKNMSASSQYDFDDQLRQAVMLLQKNPDICADIAEQYQWVLVDEYQDTNGLQNEFLWLITNQDPNPNLFAVGDDDQCIFRFQGASMANINEFRDHFPDRAEITLVENYRSHQYILDLSYQVVSHNTNRADPGKKLIAKGEAANSNPKIFRYNFPGIQTEDFFLAESINTQIKNGIKPKEIAVLVTENKTVGELISFLGSHGIAATGKNKGDILLFPSVQYIIQMLRIWQGVFQPKNLDIDADIAEVLLAPFWGIDPEKILILSRYRYEKRTDFWSLFLTHQSEKNSAEKISLGEKIPPVKNPLRDEKIQAFFHFFLRASTDFHHLEPRGVAEKIFYESGLARWLVTEKKVSEWQGVKTLLEWIGNQISAQKSGEKITIKTLLDRLQIQRDLGIQIYAEPMPGREKSVRVMTVHMSKGLEFDTVFIPRFTDRLWSAKNKNSRNLPSVVVENFNASDGDTSDRRRALFVAMTRARKNLYFSYSETKNDGKTVNPSPFWDELNKGMISDGDSHDFTVDTTPSEEIFSAPTPIKPNIFSDDERAFLQHKTENFIWSASALNKFLNCPRQFLFQELFRFPIRSNPAFSHGSAMHEAIEKFYHEPEADLDFLLQTYQKALCTRNISANQLQQDEQWGMDVLTHYYETRVKTISDRHIFGFETEYPVEKIRPIFIENIPVQGKIDKVIFLEEKKNSVQLIDYKSGMRRTIKEGSDYWRQLIFYELLVYGAPWLGWKVDAVTLEFFRPDSGGKFESSFIPSSSDRAQVVDELKEANARIKALDFYFVDDGGDEDIIFWQGLGK